MSMNSGLVSNVLTWLQPEQTTDGYGNAIDDWSNPISRRFRGLVRQVTAIEQLDGRDATVTQMQLVTPELCIGARHRIISNGLTYEVDGDPAIFSTATGPHHIEANLKRVEG